MFFAWLFLCFNNFVIASTEEINFKAPSKNSELDCSFLADFGLSKYSKEKIESEILLFSCSGYALNKDFVKECNDDYFDAFLWETIKKKNNIQGDTVAEIFVDSTQSSICIGKKEIVDYYKCKFLGNLELQEYFMKLYLIKKKLESENKYNYNILQHMFSYVDSKDLFLFESRNKIFNDLHVCIFYNMYKELLILNADKNIQSYCTSFVLNSDINNEYFFCELEGFFDFFRFFLFYFNSNNITLANIETGFLENCKKFFLIKSKNDEFFLSLSKYQHSYYGYYQLENLISHLYHDMLLFLLCEYLNDDDNDDIKLNYYDFKRNAISGPALENFQITYTKIKNKV